MLFQIARNKYLKTYFSTATITVGVSVILQKAHYSIDVYAGLIYSFASYTIVKSCTENSKKTSVIYKSDFLR